MPKRKHSSAPNKREDSSSSTEKKERRPFDDEWGKSKKKRMRRLKAKLAKQGMPNVSDNNKAEQAQTTNQSKSNAPRSSSSMSSSLQKSFAARLTGSRFRELNEELYTITSSTAFDRFSSRPELYQQYHDGFRHQVQSWPVNPVHAISKWIVVNFRKSSSTAVVVADFGCGDAELAKKLLQVQHKNKCPFVLHSFDLVSSSDLVTACDMAHVPLEDGSADIAVFCLSLMGTNLADFIREAHRVLRTRGILKIAEVRSRLEGTNDDLNDFIQMLDSLGFECTKTDRSNKMFLLLECKKNGKKPNMSLEFTAKPCIYKKR